MPRRASETPEEHLYGAQEAADFLGVHRSTLHLAVKRALLTPDSYTPGGHMRFRRETLDAYAAHLARQPATSSAHLLSHLARTLVLPDAAEAICRLAFSSIHHAVPALTMFGVAMRRPTTADPHALVHLTQQGFVPRLYDAYTQLRPNLDFAVNAVVRTGEPEICEDTTHTEALRLGTERLVRRGGLGAYAILPLRHGDDTLGVLVAASRRRHRFPSGEVSFLQSVADDLAVALVCHDLMARRDAALGSATALTRRALELRAELPAPAEAAERERAQLAGLGELLALFEERSGAALAGVATQGARAPQAVRVGIVMGPDREQPPRVKRLRTLLGRVLQGPVHAGNPVSPAASAVRRERWSDADGLHSVLALSLPLPHGGCVAAGATWRGERTAGAADEALLASLGTGAALLLGDEPALRGGER